MSTAPEALQKDIEKLPETPGVYFFRGGDDKILYIGKATSLKDRVKSYLSDDLMKTRGPRLVNMILEAQHVTHMETDSVLEALVLEAGLIKKHQPPYNTRDKDNKSFNYVVITNEEYPRVLIERGRTLPESFDESEIKYLYGPFVSGHSLQTALKILRRMFPFRDTCVPYALLSEEEKQKARPCFNTQIGLCPGVCTGEIGKREYANIIQNIRLFFEGKKTQIVKNLTREMKQAARNEEFERAARVRNTIHALEHINDAALLTRDVEIEEKYAQYTDIVRIEAYDISHTAGKDLTGVMTVIEDGYVKKGDYRRFKVRGSQPGDTEALTEVLLRRLNHPEWTLPNIMVADGGKAQKRAMERACIEAAMRTDDTHTAQKIRSIEVVSVVKDEKHRPREVIGDRETVRRHESDILLANQEAHRFAIAYHKKLRKKNFLR